MKILRTFVTMEEKERINYSKLRIDIIEKFINQRGIECANNRTDMIRQLKLDDEGKYLVETTYERYGKNQYLIGVDINHPTLLLEISKLLQKGEATRMNYAANNRLYFVVNEK